MDGDTDGHGGADPEASPQKRAAIAAVAAGVTVLVPPLADESLNSRGSLLQLAIQVGNQFSTTRKAVTDSLD
jgi:hypothetical protein